MNLHICFPSNQRIQWPILLILTDGMESYEPKPLDVFILDGDQGEQKDGEKQRISVLPFHDQQQPLGCCPVVRLLVCCS